ncbi:MAG: hypothetical protein ACF8Q5_13480 [Phycisphaerales bacterium JB040]
MFAFGALAAVLSAVPVAGQAPSERSPASNYWWALTVGAGSARFTCDLCARERDSGPWAGLAIGAAASEAVKVGVEGGFWTHLDGGVREWVYRAGVVAHVYPRAGSGLHLIGGGGWSAYRAEDIRYDAGRLTVGLGWDLPLTPGWTVGNSVTLDAASFGSLKNDQVTIDRDVGVSVLRIGVFLKRR